MRRLLAVGLGGWLACLVSVAVADERPELARASATGVSLGRPLPLPAGREASRSPIKDSAVQPASFRAPNLLPSTLRSEGAEVIGYSISEPINAPRVLPVPAGTSEFAGGPAAPTAGSMFAIDMQIEQAPPPTIAGPTPSSAPAPSLTAAQVWGVESVGPPGEFVPEGEFVEGDPGLWAGGLYADRWYCRAEYLLWWIRSQRYPVLVTTGTVDSMGILGQPGTVVLFGGDSISPGAMSGGRFTVGWWCDPEHCKGIETSIFGLGQRSIGFRADSNQFPVLTRPFFNINEGQEDVQVTAAPGRATGSLAIDAPSRLWGTEVNYRCNRCCNCKGRWDWLVGIRYLDLTESIRILEAVLVDPNIDPAQLPPGVQPGDLAFVLDDFHTRNRFIGAQIGFDWERRWGPWLLNVRGKLGLGVTNQQITIQGAQAVVHPDGTTAAFVGGLLALPSNIGQFDRTRFSVVPEIGVNIGYQVTENCLVYVGYSFLYWSNVVRPADQIDRVLDASQIPNFNVTPPPPAPQRRPIVPFRESGFWAQGMNVGLEYKY